MALKQMSYDSAEKIIDLYSQLLMDLDKLQGFEKYGYSAMQGYDIVDVLNAIKLMIAYRFFNDGRDNTGRLNEIEDYISVAQSALAFFSFHFFPDGVAHGLRQIDTTNSKESMLEQITLTKGSENYEWERLIKTKETPKSFFNFCQGMGNKDPDFWEKAYSRIGITWDSNNWKDRIYFLIKHKDYFIERKNDNRSVDIPEQSMKTVNKSTSVFKYLKDKLIKLIKT